MQHPNKDKKKQTIGLIQTGIFLTLITFCQCTTYVNFTVMPDLISYDRFPKVDYDRDNIRSIAVLDIEPSAEGAGDGKIVRESIMDDIIAHTKLKVYDRDNLSSLLKEKMYSDAGLMDDANIREEFKLKGIDAFLVGSVMINECVNIEQKDNSGAWTRYCIYHFGMSLKLISTVDGRIIFLKTHALNSRNILENPVYVEGNKVTENPSYYEDKIANAKDVITIVYGEIIDPLLNSDVPYNEARQTRKRLNSF